MIIWRNPSSSARINSWDICCNIEALFGLNFEQKAEKNEEKCIFFEKSFAEKKFCLIFALAIGKFRAQQCLFSSVGRARHS